MRRTLIAAVLVGLLSLPATAQAATTNLTIGAKADLSAGRINLPFTATCDGGTGTVIIRVAQGGLAGGLGSAPVVCDGQPHDGAVTIFGPFQPGTALAQGSLASSGGSDLDQRTIQIS